MSTNRANLLTVLGGMILACVYASISTPAHGLLPWTAPDGRVIIQEPCVGETWRLTDRGWVLVVPPGITLRTGPQVGHGIVDSSGLAIGWCSSPTCDGKCGAR